MKGTECSDLFAYVRLCSDMFAFGRKNVVRCKSDVGCLEQLFDRNGHRGSPKSNAQGPKLVPPGLRAGTSQRNVPTSSGCEVDVPLAIMSRRVNIAADLCLN